MYGRLPLRGSRPLFNHLKTKIMSRDSFGSRLGALLAMAGSAVGLGNLWRFPYLVGENGGAAFIIIYIILSFMICLPFVGIFRWLYYSMDGVVCQWGRGIWG